MLDPMMILYDEPFTGQDPISMGVLVKLIRTVNDALGLTSIIVSHDVAETLSIADEVYVISNGVVVEHGTPEALRNSQSAWVRQFVLARQTARCRSNTPPLITVTICTCLHLVCVLGWRGVPDDRHNP